MGAICLVMGLLVIWPPPFLDGLVSKQWTEATTVWSENGSSSLKFGSLSKISYDFDHRRSPAGQRLAGSGLLP